MRKRNSSAFEQWSPEYEGQVEPEGVELVPLSRTPESQSDHRNSLARDGSGCLAARYPHLYPHCG